jgi:hypothetical protein
MRRNCKMVDLVRTGKLLERVKLHNKEAAANILPKHVLRPIPQAQIDATTTGDPYPQNPVGSITIAIGNCNRQWT